MFTIVHFQFTFVHFVLEYCLKAGPDNLLGYTLYPIGQKIANYLVAVEFNIQVNILCYLIYKYLSLSVIEFYVLLLIICFYLKEIFVSEIMRHTHYHCIPG